MGTHFIQKQQDEISVYKMRLEQSRNVERTDRSDNLIPLDRIWGRSPPVPKLTDAVSV